MTLPERPADVAKPAKQPKEKKPKEKKPKPAKGPTPPKTKREPAAPTDPEQMFKEGFLATVYQERPEKEVVTRFPPEPNGYLHIGHAKAIAVNFGFAKYHGGKTYLRYDDTNPAGEKEEYFRSIEDIVRWLGFKPVAITHSSDHFDRLYDLAVELIKKDGAYVCHCSSGFHVFRRWVVRHVKADTSRQRPKSKPSAVEGKVKVVLVTHARIVTVPSRNRSVNSSACGMATTRPRRPRCA